MSPINPPSKFEKCTTMFNLMRITIINILSKYFDIDEYLKLDYFEIGRKISLLSIPFQLVFGFISLFFLGIPQCIGIFSIISSVLLFIIEKPVECQSCLIKKMKNSYFKIYFLLVSGIISCLNIFTILGGLIQMCSGLFYIYLFYKGELHSNSFIIRITQNDIDKYQSEFL